MPSPSLQKSFISTALAQHSLVACSATLFCHLISLQPAHLRRIAMAFLFLDNRRPPPAKMTSRPWPTHPCPPGL
ncbi:uncharacterized protein BKA78DRAFT_321306 [Phyllosticta capitalensis]|uniref:uncharacterized protein n=1 Tax=Phyllosticta capitalensis TaxID=121624 RepID=UPI00312DBC71